MNKKIGISGKRYFKDNEESKVKEELITVIDSVLEDTRQKTFTGISMLATGADSVFASLVLDDYKQELHVILPFPKEEYEKDFSAAELKVFNELITRAAKVTVANKAIPKNDEERNAAYQFAGLKIAEEANDMIFVWDKIKPAGIGGTADILSYYSEHHQTKKIHLITTPPKSQTGLQYRLYSAFKNAEKISQDNRAGHNWVWLLSILMGWVAAGAFAAKTGYEIEHETGYLLTVIETVLILSVAAIVWYGIKKEFHKEFLKQRVRAEQLRVLIEFCQIGSEVEIPMYAERDDIELINFVKEVNDEAKAPAYHSKWYSNYTIKTLINKQIAYHTGKIDDVSKPQERWEFAKHVIVGLFLINLVAHFSVATAHHSFCKEEAEWFKYLSTALSIFLPATYAAIEGVLSFNNWKSIKNHSRFVKKNLEESAKKVIKNIDEETEQANDELQVKLLTEVATVMLNDNQNWQIMAEDKADYHIII